MEETQEGYCERCKVDRSFAVIDSKFEDSCISTGRILAKLKIECQECGHSFWI